ncbi:hypothetical protein SPHINGOAX6_20100 [Sphingomonas sp. AX6]|nr:hypothetical protein SPHINGOAX6_20100 [Sphingomonas sp. AX6]
MVEVRGQAFGAHQLTVALDHHIAAQGGQVGDLFTIEKRVILIAQVARLLGIGDLLRQARTQRIGARDDDPVFDAQFQEGVAAGADLCEKVLVRHGDLAILMPALLFVADLIFDLERARPRLDHLFRQQIGCLGIAEARVDIGDDRHDMGFVMVDGVGQSLNLDMVSGIACGVEIAEHHAQFARVGLFEEGVEFLDQRRDAGLFMHRLVGQRAEIAAQRGDHPAGEIEVAALGRSEMLLDADELLLADESVPAAQRLGVLRRIGVIGRHVAAHDACGIACDVEPSAEAVLRLHPRDAFRIDAVPCAAEALDERLGAGDLILIGHVENSPDGLCGQEMSVGTPSAPTDTFPPQELVGSGAGPEPGRASAETAEAVIEIREFGRTRIVGDLFDVIRHRFLHQSEVLVGEDGAAALGFGGHFDAPARFVRLSAVTP